MDQPTQPTRPDCLYVSRLVRAGLFLAKYKLGDTYPGPDGLADMVLSEWLAKEHPEIHKHLSDREANDKRFRESIKPKLPLG